MIIEVCSLGSKEYGAELFITVAIELLQTSYFYNILARSETKQEPFFLRHLMGLAYILPRHLRIKNLQRGASCTIDSGHMIH